MLRVLISVVVIGLSGGAGFVAGQLASPQPCQPGPGEKERAAGLKTDLANWRLRLHQLESLPVAYEELKKGKPLPWPDSIPDQYRPEPFQAIVRRALEEIQAPVDLVGFECNESPCIAMMRIHEGAISKIQLSRAWQQNFGKGITGSPVLVDCPDGHQENIELVAAEWNGKHDPRGMSPEAYKQAMQEEAQRLMRGRITKEEAERGKRLSLRLRVCRLFWECAP